MGYAYLGLGLGGVIAPPAANALIHAFGWRHALQAVGMLILAVLFPVGAWVTRSSPSDMHLLPDGVPWEAGAGRESGREFGQVPSLSLGDAIKTRNFWLLLGGSALVMGSINTVIQHFVLFLQDHGYSRTLASRFLSALLVASLVGRVVVGYLADRFVKKNTMAIFYAVIGASIPLLLIANHPVAAWSFTVAFGVAMGADYMLIPLVTAECFGVQSLGKLLAIIIMGYSVGQWVAPWIAGRIFDAYHTYNPAWKLMGAAGVIGSIAIYAISETHSMLRKGAQAEGV